LILNETLNKRSKTKEQQKPSGARLHAANAVLSLQIVVMVRSKPAEAGCWLFVAICSCVQCNNAAEKEHNTAYDFNVTAVHISVISISTKERKNHSTNGYNCDEEF
jgi:hypothetical protein